MVKDTRIAVMPVACYKVVRYNRESSRTRYQITFRGDIPFLRFGKTVDYAAQPCEQSLQ